MNENTFIGLKPYQSNESEYFPARSNEIKKLIFLLNNNSINILCGESKSGKTSLINCALSPNNLDSNNAVAVIFNIPTFHFGDKVLVKQLVDTVDNYCNKPTYLDLAFSNDGSLWFALKKIQACFPNCRRFYFVFDNFENIFTYGQAARQEFMTQISEIVKGNNPINYQSEIQKIIMGESDVTIPKDSMPLLLDNPPISFLLSIRKNMYGGIAQFNNIIHNIYNNTLELQQFDVDMAKEAVKMIANQPFDDLMPIELEQEAIEKIVSHFAENGGTIYPGRLRNAILYLRSKTQEKIVRDKEINNSDILTISPTDLALNELSDPERSNMINFMKAEMFIENETQPLSAYKGIANLRYNISDETLALMENLYVVSSNIGNDCRTYYQPFDNEATRSISAIKTENKKSPTPAPTPLLAVDLLNNKKSGKNLHIDKKYIFLIALVVFTCVATIITAFSIKEDSLREANSAKSAIMAAFAFQKLESDPTLSLRLSQNAVQLDSSNMNAYSALLNSFYNTDVFYNISNKLNSNVIKADISENGEFVMTYEFDKETNQYIARIIKKNGDLLVEIPHNSEISHIAMSADCSKILTTSWDSIARIFDTSGKLINEIKGHKTVLLSGDISHNGKMVVTAGSDYKLMLWSIDGEYIRTFSGHDFDVYCARFSPDDITILSTSFDNTARLWDINGKQLKEMQIRENKEFSNSLINDAVFAPNGKYILLAANDQNNKNHKARLWDLEGNELITYEGHNDFINSVQFSPDCQYVITACRDKIIRVFNLKGKLKKILKGHNSNVWSARFMSDNQSMISVSDDHTIRTWSIGKRSGNYDEKSIKVGHAEFSPNGLNIMMVQDSIAQSWALTDKILAEFKGHNDIINKAHFSPDGKFVITVSDDKTAKIWNSNGTLESTLLLKHEAQDGVFSPDGKFVAIVSTDTVLTIKNLETGEVTYSGGHNDIITCVGFAPNSKAYATGSIGGKVIIHDIDGNIQKIFNGHDGQVNSVNFSPDGQNIISTSSDKTAVLWDNLGQMKVTFRGYENKVNSAVFSPDGKYIITTSDDGTASLWTTDGKDVMKFRHEGKVTFAEFSPDGKYILTVYYNADGNKTLRLRLVNSDEITKHIDKLELFGTVWQPDEETKKQYGM